MLQGLLQTIRNPADVSKLLVGLGYTADDIPYETDATVVARWKGFQVVAVAATNPRERARSLAQSLAGNSARALAVAIGAPAEIVLCAPRLGAPGVSRILVVPLQEASAAVLQHLERFRPKPSSTGLAHALRVEELLATEIAGERFYAAFRIVLERMAGSLRGAGTEADRRMVALLPLTRLLFLYFVQAKGWLNHDLDYLRNLLDDALAAERHFHGSSLNPLFFETLNRPPRARRRVAHLGRIPYLNGGMFQPHPVEQRLQVVFSNELWRDAFDHLFERFRFCVREADEVDAIAPDMLGRVFERVMEAEARHETGTFYTPETVVHHIVIASIETALLGDEVLTPEHVRRLVHCKRIDATLRRRARSKLHQLRVLDPAVGSGAFLLGALENLCDMHAALGERRGAAIRRHALRRRILRENLFGVDLNPIAVRLTELRLWLAVIADDPTSEIGAIDPLPNLDGVIRQGDSMHDPLSSAMAAGIRPTVLPRHQAKGVAAARATLFAARGSEVSPATKRLRTAEKNLAKTLLDDAKTRVDQTLRDLAASARGRDLFGTRSGLTTPQRRAYRLYRDHREALRRALARLRDGSVPFFSFEVHAPDTMRAGGFSVVVGNPPWVRSERLPPGLRRSLSTRFTWWRGSTVRGYSHLPDLSVAFLQRALELAAPGGAVGMLVPSKFATAGYAETARAHVVRETSLRYLHRVPEREAAQFRATTYPLALILQNKTPDREHAVRVGLGESNPAKLRQRVLAQPGPWILVPDEMRAALDAFRASGKPLHELAPPALGVKTGANSIFIGELVHRDGRLSRVRFGAETIEMETRMLRPVLRGRDVRAFGATPSRVLLWGYDAHNEPMKALPPLAAAHMAAHQRRALARADFVHGPPWTLHRLAAALSPNRVVWPDIARRPNAVALDETQARAALPLNSCYVSTAPDGHTALIICAVLNSSFALALVTSTADEARGGYRRVNARAVADVPIPRTGAAIEELASLARRYQHHEQFHQGDLDAAVAEALGLATRHSDRLRRLAEDHR